ncbi:MAG: hypothetical protein KC776_02200 [Myxococcales bacterium]|nr:hypothetical protein [Myxococcales bacterium]MCB9582398.1 hypothetical protein [Polyangiaceae bacterium]
MRSAFVTAVTAAALLVAAPAVADDAEPCTGTPAQCGKRAFLAGVKAYKAGDFALATRRFNEAYDAKPHPVVLFNLALAEAKSEKYVAATEHFAAVAADAQTPKALRPKAEAERDRAERATARVEVQATGNTVSATVDGVAMTGAPPSTRVDPGQHDVQVTVDGKPALSRRVTLARGERLTLALSHSREVVVTRGGGPTTPKRDRGTPSHGVSPVWFYAGVGATAVLGGVTVWSALDTKSAFDDYERDLPDLDQAQVDQRVNDGHDKELRTNVLIGVTAAAAVATAAVGVLLVDWRLGSQSAALSVTPGGATLSGRF